MMYKNTTIFQKRRTKQRTPYAVISILWHGKYKYKIHSNHWNGTFLRRILLFNVCPSSQHPCLMYLAHFHQMHKGSAQQFFVPNNNLFSMVSFPRLHRIWFYEVDKYCNNLRSFANGKNNGYGKSIVQINTIKYIQFV